MNATIQGIIDHMFKDTAVTAETRALHEELLNNCLEHYDDLIARGMSDTEAIDAVVDSLKGMKEVIDEYPKKPGTAEKTEEEKEPEIPAIREDRNEEPMREAKPEQQPAEEKPREYTFSADQVRKLRTELKSSDLKIGLSGDNRIHVHCEDMDQLVCSLDGDVLSVRTMDRTKQSLEEAGRQINSQDFSLKGPLNFLGKTIGSVASSITVSWNIYIDLPGNPLREMDLSAKSGDVEVNAALPEQLTIRTMSGDVRVNFSGRAKAEKADISTMSGDIEFFGSADRIRMSSMSGDVTAEGMFSETELKSTSGEVKLSGEAETIRLHSVSGDVTAKPRNADIRSIEARSTSGDAEIELAPGTDSVHASLSTVSGSASCRVPDSGSGARLQINASSVSGDVIVR